MKKFTGFISICCLVLLYAITTYADGRKKRAVNPDEWSPYSCCHNLDDTARRPGEITEIHLVPDFYFPDTIYTGDTAVFYACYNRQDSLIDADTVLNFAGISYISLFSKFTDHQHTYRDHGRDLPLPVSVITHRYDRISPHKWSSIAYPKGNYTQLSEYRNEIIKTDTLASVDSAAHFTVIYIYHYYKTGIEN